MNKAEFEVKTVDAGHYFEYLKDESRLQGNCQAICFPKDESQAEEAAVWAWRQGKRVTAQGARTGIAGAAVPVESDLILNMEQMNRILSLEEKDGELFLDVEPGLTLEMLERALASGRLNAQEPISPQAQEAFAGAAWEFAPNPTEKTASLGGVFATGAAGINECAVGPTSRYFAAATLFSPARGKWEIRRGDLAVQEPVSSQSRWKKPLVIGKRQDLLDVLCGSEGTLGLVTRLKLRLTRRPGQTWGILCFFEDEEQAAAFAFKRTEKKTQDTVCRGLEFFDEASLLAVEELKKSASKLRGIPPIPEGARAAVYTEICAESEEAMDTALQELLAELEQAGGKEEMTWAASEPEELEKFRLFRHAVPESLNHSVDETRKHLPSVHKIGTDFCAPTEKLLPLLTMYRKDIRAAGLRGAVFGHVFDAHLHVNLLPKTAGEIDRARELVASWAERIMAMGGWIAKENGIGKIKKDLYRAYLSAEERESIAKLKHYFDPDGYLNPGNLL